jgi:hypothetical protein
VLYGASVVDGGRLPLFTGGTRNPPPASTNPKDITMHKFTTFATGITLAVASLGAFAQGSAPVTPRIDQREANEQARIDAGVASGQLTRREALRLQRQQTRIRHAEAKAKADGVVTPTERRELTRMQDESSANIHAQKHDAQVAKRP